MIQFIVRCYRFAATDPSGENLEPLGCQYKIFNGTPDDLMELEKLMTKPGPAVYGVEIVGASVASESEEQPAQ